MNRVTPGGMRALLCRRFGPIDALELEEIELPRPGARQLRVRVDAAGVNFPDTLIVQGLYQFKPPFPFSPGGEIAGEVLELGEKVTGFEVGDRVMAAIGWGGFAEEVLVDASQALPVPDTLPTEIAGALLLTYATGYHALVDRAGLQPGETVAVLGAGGGAGLAAVELAKALGARVIACASSDEKLAPCAERGADVLVNYGKDDLKEALGDATAGTGVDVLYDPVGGTLAEPALRRMAWGGRYLVVGFASGEIPKIPMNLPLLKGCSVVGVFWGAFAAREPERFLEHVKALIDLHAQGKLRVHVHGTYRLEQAKEALREVAERRVRGKAIITPSGRPVGA